MTDSRFPTSPWKKWGRGILASCVVVAAFALVSCSSPAPVLGRLTSFSLISQDGKTFSDRDLVGKIWVVDFIYTSCGSYCPMLTQRMSELQKSLDSEPRVGFLSITVDPEVDTPERMKEYSSRWSVPPHWLFLTGRVEDIQKTVTEGFKLAYARENVSDIFHSNKFVVLDGQGRIRGYFDTESRSVSEDVRAMIKRLLKEG